MANVESAELQTIKMFLLRGRLGTHYYWTGSIDAFEIEIDSNDDDCRFWTGKVMLAQGSFDETERVKEHVLLGLSLRYIFDHEDAYTLEDGVEFSEMNPKDIFEVVEFQDMVEFWRDDINDLDMAWKDRNHGDCFQDDVMKAIMRVISCHNTYCLFPCAELDHEESLLFHFLFVSASTRRVISLFVIAKPVSLDVAKRCARMREAGESPDETLLYGSSSSLAGDASPSGPS